MAAMREVAQRFFDKSSWKAGEARSSVTRARRSPRRSTRWPVAYTERMKGLLTLLPDGTAEVRRFQVDEAHNNVTAFGVFRDAHGRGRAGTADREACRGRLRLRHGLRRHKIGRDQDRTTGPAQLGWA